MDQKVRVELQESILLELGALPDKSVPILDLGCGNGGVVMEYRNSGYDAYGCDFVFKQGEHAGRLEAAGFIRVIDPDYYRLPFDDDYFDVVVSDQVLEHVHDYPGILAEIQRVLKPNGWSMHIFPSRYMPIEPHVFVPLATIVQKRWWMYLWALLGVRTLEQRGLGFSEVAKYNYEYLTRNTNYLTRKQIVAHIEEYFDDIRCCEHLFLKYSRRGKILYRMSKMMPFLPGLYGAWRNRVIVFRKTA
ncbi:MAG: class I SAM-dependent methyltransferase [Gammaproteobacteria bacterium]|nr:class I SAM-dependent methyltransferase [Gammaproteobacteria bacterium]